MAVTLKRKRGAVSYKEPSSDEGLSESTDQDRITSKKGVTASRRSTRNPPTKSDRADSRQPTASKRHTVSKPPNGPRSSRNSGRQRISYKDVSSDEEEDDDPDADFELPERPARAPPTKSQHTSIRSTRSQKSPSSKEKPRRMVNFGAPLRPNNATQAERPVVAIPSDGRTPSWASLPYHVLLQIFVYASHPLHDENMKATSSISWLVQAARICSAFTKPALTALYRNPPIFAIRQTRKDLVHHLITPPLEAHEEYRVMVKRLEIDATQMSALTDATHSVEDLASLVRSLTTLREIEIFDPFDRPPYRERLRRIRRWVYPKALFEALEHSELRLRTWRWNSAFCDQGMLWMKTMHGNSAFQSLRDITLTKFHPEASPEDQGNLEGTQAQPTSEELLASALAVLPNLRVLSFETCGVVSGRLLPLLPPNLFSLNITNCGELLSDALQAFLATHGAHLEELILHHNQALDLSFLVDLKHSCPRLEILRMDTTYYSSLEMSSDNEPLYATLLGETEIPSWPSSLRIIDMEYLRNWNSISATNFFTSLIDAAEDLPRLRELTIMAMVDTDWRQRAKFRMRWSAVFKRVFARKWVAPNSHLVSFKAFREWKAQAKDEEKNDSLIEGIVNESSNAQNPKDTGEESDSDVPLLSQRQHKKDEKWDSKRLRSRSSAIVSYDDSSEKETQSEDDAESEGDDVPFVQGRCHTVIFRIDNFRPREEIYGEADFLDAEPSGDEEWNGNEEYDEEGAYAW